MESVTEGEIIKVLKNNPDLNILDISKKLSLERHTVSKYLEVLKSKGVVSFSNKGKSKLWRLTNNSLSQLLGMNDFISSQVLDLFRSLNYDVSIQSKNYDVVWHSGSDKRGKCYKILKGKKEHCENCGAQRVFETGLPQQSRVDKGSRKKNFVFQPIKNEEGEVVAVIELSGDI